MEIEIIFQLLLSVFLGSLVGLEREYKKKGAGIQTYSLVTLAACLFTIIFFELLNVFPGKSETAVNFVGLIQAIATGLGFIGAGVVFHQSSGVIGLTTATGLWTMGAVGVAVGTGFYFLAIVSTLLIVIVLAGLGLIEEKYLKYDKKE